MLGLEEGELQSVGGHIFPLKNVSVSHAVRKSHCCFSDTSTGAGWAGMCPAAESSSLVSVWRLEFWGYCHMSLAGTTSSHWLLPMENPYSFHGTVALVPAIPMRVVSYSFILNMGRNLTPDVPDPGFSKHWLNISHLDLMYLIQMKILILQG